MRKQHEEEPDNHERWLISYADFITLLFAFFVVMYAISQVNEGKYRVLSDALLQAFKPDAQTAYVINPQVGPQGTHSGIPSGVIPRLRVRPSEDPAKRAREERMRNIARDVLKALGPLVEEGKVRVKQSARGIAVEINASVLFQSAQAGLEPESFRVLSAVAQVLAPIDNAIEVEGHTDREAIRTSQFPSNWELSGARASSVVRLFIERGVAPSRLVASGYSDTRPLTSDETPDGRARNRRVTVMIHTEPVDSDAGAELSDGQGLKSEPSEAPPANAAPPANEAQQR